MAALSEPRQGFTMGRTISEENQRVSRALRFQP